MRPEILIASKNRDKVTEIKDILHDLPVMLRTLMDYREIDAPAENGHTFKENALIKAHYYYTQCGIAVIADDSGLVVPVLGGEPGVNSARYAGIYGNYKANNKKLLEKMSGLGAEERTAYFVCHAVYFNGTEYIESEGRVAGIITDRERGQQGFGYDPVFLYPQLDKTFGELPSAEKNKISHRKIAFFSLAEKLAKKLK